MKNSEISKAMKLNPEYLNDSLKLTTERSVYVSALVFDVFEKICNRLKRKNPCSAKDSI